MQNKIAIRFLQRYLAAIEPDILFWRTPKQSILDLYSSAGLQMKAIIVLCLLDV